MIKHRLLTLFTLLATICIVTEAQSVFKLAVEAYNNEQYGMAMSYLDQIISQQPNHGYAWGYKGAILRGELKMQEAADAYTTAINNLDETKDGEFAAWAYSQRGAVRAELGDTIAALADINEAIRLAPNKGGYYQDRAIITYGQKNYQQALSDAQHANQLEPGDVNNLDLIGRCYLHLQQRDKAVEAFNNAAIAEPSNADYWHKLAAQVSEFNADMTYSSQERDTVLTDNVVLPQFPGGRQALFDYINNHIQYPEQALKDGTQGRVIIDCLIDEKGQVTDTQVIQSVSTQLDTEAQRVCQSLPAFTPATRNGAPTSCWYQIVVDFHTGNYCKTKPNNVP